MWNEISTHIQKVAIEVFEIIKQNKHESKDTWWENDDVQKTNSVKKNATNIYITTGVMKTYRSTKKLEETQRKL
jgi:formyltetrahydrofolate synthetase